MLSRVKWSLRCTHRHGRADTHMLHVCIGEQMGCTNTPTHTRMHAPPPPLPGVLIWHSIYTHIYSVYSLLYEADRYLSATLLWGARASWRCNQTVHSLRALSHCSFNNGLWEMHKEWAACSREGGQAGRQAPGIKTPLKWPRLLGEKKQSVRVQWLTWEQHEEEEELFKMILMPICFSLLFFSTSCIRNQQRVKVC